MQMRVSTPTAWSRRCVSRSRCRTVVYEYESKRVKSYYSFELLHIIMMENIGGECGHRSDELLLSLVSKNNTEMLIPFPE
jgi:hypothetical protein